MPSKFVDAVDGWIRTNLTEDVRQIQGLKEMGTGLSFWVPAAICICSVVLLEKTTIPVNHQFLYCKFLRPVLDRFGIISFAGGASMFLLSLVTFFLPERPYEWLTAPC